MTWKPEPRKPAMVMVEHRAHEPNMWRVIAPGSFGGFDLVNASGLHPIPPALTPEDEAVLAAAEAAERDEIGSRDRLFRAVRVRRAAMPAPQPATAEPAFRVGDRVRVKDDPKWLHHGKLGTIRRIVDCDINARCAYVAIDGLEGPAICFHTDGIELVADAPATDPIAAAKERVVEAAMKQQKLGHTLYSEKGRKDYEAACIATSDAIVALRALLPPPDPQAALLAAASALLTLQPVTDEDDGERYWVTPKEMERLRAAVAAVKDAE